MAGCIHKIVFFGKVSTKTAVRCYKWINLYDKKIGMREIFLPMQISDIYRMFSCLKKQATNSE